MMKSSRFGLEVSHPADWSEESIFIITSLSENCISGLIPRQGYFYMSINMRKCVSKPIMKLTAKNSNLLHNFKYSSSARLVQTSFVLYDSNVKLVLVSKWSVRIFPPDFPWDNMNK